MSDEFYAPPATDIEAPDTDLDPYYVVSPRKFFLLSMFTVHLYFIYWMYRNWRLVKERTGESMWPVMRGLFYIFFVHSLLTDVDMAMRDKDRNYNWHPTTTATLFLLLVIIGFVLSRLAYNEIGSPTTDVLQLLLMPIAPLILLPAQRAINTVCDDPTGSSNSSMTLGNWVWIVLGTLYWSLILIGLYVLYVDPERLAT